MFQAHGDSLQDVIGELCTQLSLNELSDQVFSYMQDLEEVSHSQPLVGLETHVEFFWNSLRVFSFKELNELIACTIYVSMIEARLVMWFTFMTFMDIHMNYLLA